MKQVQNMGFGNAHYFKDVASPKLDEIKQLLDNNSSSSKLEGMKRLIAMISKGKDVSSFFPDVVKNVICPSPEVKKLVYNYLIHYAEFQQDAALLSINTFQKDLDNSNQLIRAQALRILTSIRLKVIVQIQVLAVKKCVTDSSPYVRKTAAHAIPKVYHIDPSQKIELVECIETLLGDNTTLVLGSAIGAFNEVCPDRYDLLHGHYRKICGMLADFDEWGQVYTINTLTRYVRKHFVDPNPNSLKAKANGETKKKKGKGFYSDSESDESDEEDDYGSDLISEMDADHRTALRVTLPLLQSRNTAVTLAVASLFFYCAPHAEALRAGKALVRACRAHREIQFLLLQNIATMAVSRPELFAPYVSEFFIDETDPVIIRNTKLEILTCVATESNIARILRELTHYVHREEKEFVKCVIQAIVKCASRLEEVQDTCMHGLMSLISNPSDTVVAESVIAIKKLLQMGAGEDKRIVKNLVKLLDKIKVPSARASIIWCVGEYSSKIPKIAPDVLRKLAQTFSDEDAAVRMQILNLGCKLVLNNPHQTQFIFQYVINLAKYDVSYDIRDRARTLRSILTRPGSALLPFAKRLFSAEKPAPEDHFPYKERERWALGSISHSVGQTAAGYTEIPEWTTEVQGLDERNVVPKKQRKDFVGMGSDSIRFTPPPAARSTSSSSQTIDDFYGDNYRSRSRSRSRSYSRSRSGSYSRSRSGSYSRSRSRSRSRSGSYSRSRSRSRSYTPSQSRSRSRTPPRRGRGKYRSVSPSRSPSGSRSRSRSYSPPGSDRDHSDDDRSPQKKGGDDLQSAFFGSPVASPGGQSLLEAFGGATLSSSPLLRPSSSDSIMGSLSSVSFGGGAELPREVLLKKVVGNGLQVEYQFQRSISIRGPSYLPVRIWVQNASDTAITSVVISSVSSIDGAELIPFDLIPIVHPGATVEVIANVKFASFSDGLKFKIEHSNGSFPVSITVPVGELLKPEPVSVATFADLQKKWGGLQESSLSVSLGPKSASKVLDRVLSAANVGVVEVTASSLKLSGRATLPSAEQILILVDLSGSPQVTSYVYSDNPILANNLNNAIASLLRN